MYYTAPGLLLLLLLTLLLQIQLIQASVKVGALKRSEKKSASALEREISEEIGNSWLGIKKQLFHMILQRARNSVKLRERTKSITITVNDYLKKLYRNLAITLYFNGKLNDSDSIYYLTHDEVKELVSVSATEVLELREFTSLLVLRKHTQQQQAKLQFDEICVGKPEPITENNNNNTTSETNDNNNNANDYNFDDEDDKFVSIRLTGTGVSRGVVVGKVRVALSLEDASSLLPNEILVAPSTDVGWTPYFTLAAGLATDIGGVVSHGAVVAREYGIPCVVACRNATRVLKTGDIVKLDGTSGQVIKLRKNNVEIQDDSSYICKKEL